MSDVATPVLLSQGVGYGIIIGVGTVFAVGIVLATKAMNKYLHEDSNSTEMFMVANRSVGVGLTGSAVFSSWMWATVYLWAVTMVYYYGIAAAFWYAAGSSVQICVLSILGIECKKKIPRAHTCLEVIKLRYGTVGHITYLFLCLANNLLSCSSMILGAAAAITALTGMHIAAATILIPFGVLLYTAVGGLKSTFLTDYMHTLIAMALLCYFSTAILASDYIGGIGGLYDKVKAVDGNRYIDGNYEGSLLTFKSKGAVIFGLIHSLGDFGLSVMDSSFWQKSFSANVRSAVPGYIIGAIAIYCVAWPLGGIGGLAAVVIENLDIFPTYPRSMTTDEIDSGFVLPFLLKALLGKGACAGLVLALFMAVTSTVSAQTISVSSILSFDVYRTYINPKANNKQLIRLSHVTVVFFGLFAAAFSLMLNYVGVNMTWMGYFYPMIICPGIIPLCLSIIWDMQSTVAAVVSPIVGMILAIGTWLGVAKNMYGEINMTTTVEQLPCLYGGLVATFVPAILTVVISLIQRQRFDWNVFDQATLVETESSSSDDSTVGEVEKKSDGVSEVVHDYDSDPEGLDEDANNQKYIDKWIKVAYWFGLFDLLITWVIWPLPLYRDWIWNKAFFEGWNIVAVFWLFMTFFLVVIFPLYDGRHALAKVFRGIYRSITKKA